MFNFIAYQNKESPTITNICGVLHPWHYRKCIYINIYIYIQNFPNFLSFLVIFCFSFCLYVLLVNCTLPFIKSHQMPISNIFFQIFTWYLMPLRSKLSRVSQVQVYTVFCFVSVCILTMKVISAPLMFSWCITCINSSLTWYKYLIYLLELVNQ